MDALPLTDLERIEHFDAVFIEYIGGDEVWHMLISHRQGLSYRQIAAMYGESHMTVRRRIVSAKVKLRAVGLDADAIAPRAGHQPPATISTHHA
jgi:hypothetical protein